MSSLHHPESERPSPANVDELVLVVHGVGDPKPGETLSLFARSIAESGHPLTEHQEILWLEDEPARQRDVKTFSTHVRRLEYSGGKAVLSEVFWGDLSKVSRGTVGIVLGMIEIIFGLRYVAFVASQQAGWAAKNLQRFGLICSRILNGPLLAVNYILACMLFTVAITEFLWPGSSAKPGWTGALVLGCVCISLISSFIGGQMTANPVVKRFWFWVFVAAGFLSVLMVAVTMNWVQSPHVITLLWYCRVFVVLMEALWVSLVAVLAAMFVCWGFAINKPGAHGSALHVALILPALAIGFWGLILPIVWMSATHTIRKSIVLSNFDSMFNEAVPLLGIQFLMCILLAAVLLLHLGRYFRWRDKATVEEYNNGKRAPRLIVHSWVQMLAGTSAAVGVVLVFYLAILEIPGVGNSSNPVVNFLSEAKQYSIGMLVPMGAILFLTLHYLRSGLDIILDVVNHFYFRPATAEDHEECEDEFDILEVSFDEGQMYFSRRDAIHRRMKRILDYYRDSLEGNPTLTIVSHSQGTMIAIEVLNDEELAWVNQKFGQVNLVTMGSPFHHIYQQYFPHLYPDLSDGHWNNLKSRVGQWINIFRIDDFVGTDMQFPADTATLTYENIAVERRGHQLYWCDRQVLSVIRDHDVCRSLSEVTTASKAA